MVGVWMQMMWLGFWFWVINQGDSHRNNSGPWVNKRQWQNSAECASEGAP